MTAGVLSVVFFLKSVPAKFYLWGIAAVVLAALAELFQKQLKVDDNFSIPLCVGAVLFFSSFLV